jgi:hypothetical protein
MTSPRLPKGPPESNFGIAFEPKHRRHARALSTAVWGKAAEVARITGISERMLQYFMEPQSRHRGPGEHLSSIVTAAIEIGTPRVDALAPLREVCRDVGVHLVDDEARRPALAKDLPESIAKYSREAHDVLDVLLRRCLDEDGVTEEDRQVFEKELSELEEKQARLRRELQVLAARGGK